MLMNFDFILVAMLVQRGFILAAMQLDAVRSRTLPMLMKPYFILATTLMQLDFTVAVTQLEAISSWPPC